MSPDAVVLEVALIKLLSLDALLSPLSSSDAASEDAAQSPDSQRSSHADASRRWHEVWNEVDEQALPVALRRRLTQNGFRCGVLDGRPSPALQAALDEHAKQEATSPASEKESRTPTGLQRLQNRAGRRGKVVTSEVHESLVVLLPDAGRLHGKTYPSAQCLFSVRSFPQGDGSSELELTPEIEHGDVRPRWLGEASEGTFRVDTSRERLEFDSLRISTRLTPGQMLIIGPQIPLKGLGRQFFAQRAQGEDQPRLLVIRLAQTQLDDLFAPEQKRAPLVSVPD